ncbi:hypothetical protein FA95DRAFT_1614232 [Auriscalpium vulgare]|uniref:Uncharacterized protein n=1 Tax=Auriscalpium vulgare TaxID=40419 RepID=A0ACB8R0I5_9AGAM|nr:hypothetical protein FA95DRAFT_1614232 [Auriscalpium vulgare]
MANRIIINPYDQQAPQYRPEIITRAVVGAETQDEARTRLLDLWNDNNLLERAAWDAQVAADKVAKDAAAAQVAATKAQEKKLADEEAEKRRPPYPAFNPKGMVGDSREFRPSDTAINLLRAGKYAPLFYFTREGRQSYGSSTSSNAAEALEELLSLVRKDGDFVVQPSAVKIKPGEEDQHLSVLQVSSGLRNLIDTMVQLRCPSEHTDALEQFLWRWTNHRSHGDKHGSDVLIRYQAYVRKRWHDSLALPRIEDRTNISLWNDKLFDELKADYRDEMFTSVVDRSVLPS